MNISKDSMQPENPWSNSMFRGDLALRFIIEKTGALDQKNVLDIGAGPGILSIALAARAKSLVSLEPAPDYFSLLKQRVGESNIKNIELINDSFLNAPLKENYFDMIMLNGVLEWMAMNTEDPLEVHRKVLKKAFSLLKKGGFLYLGIENRWFPMNIFHDPHRETPIVCMLPRKLADLACKITGKRVYDTPIYSYWELAAVLKNAGFDKSEIYTPVINYQYPSVVLSLDDNSSLSDGQIQRIYSDYEKLGITKNLAAKLSFVKVIRALGLTKLFTKSFIAIAYK